MTLQAFPRFETYPTHYCATGSVKPVYHYHGYPVSEDLLLGLGEGIGFVYFHIKGADPFYGGRGNVARPGTEGLEKTIGRRTGVVVESHRTSSARKAQLALRELLDAAEPVLVYLDMGSLPYFDLPDDFHFGGHVVVVAGHDHTWYTFDFSAARQPSPQEIREAIAAACDAMLEPPISNLSVKGIRRAITETRKWPKLLDETALRRTCTNVAMFIDHRGGTGGGIFRYMYARFLQEAAALVDEPDLADLAAQLNKIGDQWETVAGAFSEAALAHDLAEQIVAATEPMHQIAESEAGFWQQLAGVAST